MRNVFEIQSLVIFIMELPSFLKIWEIFNLSYIYPNHLKNLKQNMIYEQKLVFYHSVSCFSCFSPHITVFRAHFPSV